MPQRFSIVEVVSPVDQSNVTKPTPDVEVTTDQILVEEIDIPVEIKSDYPIQVEIENSGTYIEVREI